uniref:Uncharacterized protein AlNc14C5G795 n=1 Tax=Albugo laibachii Nc14 TaxID=890382 RepID=F0W115_9STRA|nr:conserved hypothetical protein [Albugo laibachii Nc14]|eukprot:CCA14739.1 conserved hypothetical protein [Albugo laibachii Nc14]
MSWLRGVEISVPRWETKASRCSYCIRLRTPRDTRARTTSENVFWSASRTYSDFREFRTELKKLTKADAEPKKREPMASELGPEIDPGPQHLAADQKDFGSSLCHCNGNQCPFREMYSFLKAIPFPSRVLSIVPYRSQAKMESRRLALHNFLSSVHQFCMSIPRATLQRIDLYEQCDILLLFSAFIGFDESLRSRLLTRSPVSLAAWKDSLEADFSFSTSTSTSPSINQTSSVFPSPNTENQIESENEVVDDTDALSGLEYELVAAQLGDSVVPMDDIVDRIPMLEHPSQQVVLERRTAEFDTFIDVEEEHSDAKSKHSAVQVLSELSRLPRLRVHSASVKKTRAFIEELRHYLLLQFRPECLTAELEHHESLFHLSQTRQWELALYVACDVGNLNAVKLFLGRGTDPTTWIRHDQTSALMAACATGNRDILGLLLAHQELELDWCDHEGRTALMVAVECGQDEIVRLLLEAGANASLSCSMGITGLHRAATIESVAIMEMLLAHYPDVNLNLGPAGNTPLHLAAHSGRFEQSALLMAHGADISLRNFKGDSAWDLAIDQMHWRIANLLTAE